MGCFAWLKSLLTHKSDHLRNLEIPSTKSLYTTLEIIPNKLQLFVYSHTISLHELDSDPFQKEKHLESQIACWTFLSHGLSVHGQKEIYFTLRRYEDEDENDIPVNIKDLYHAFYILARKGSRVDIGGYSNFGNEIIFSNTDMNKIIYTEKQKDEIGLPSQVLHAILITNEEYEVYVNYGISRLLARMGYARRYFPFPPWSERLRESVVTMDDMKSSILNIIGSIIQILGVRVTRLRNKTIKLNISPNSHEIIYNVLRETGFNGVLTILTGIDKQANSCLVWNGNHEELNANSSGYLSTRLGGCFITFCSQQPADRVQVAEDGFILFLTDNTFQQIYQALISRNSLNIKPNENVHIVLEWDNEERFSNENYNNEHVADLILLELLTNENRLQDRISLNSQAQYTGKIDNVVKKHFSSMHKSNGFNLSIFFTLKENEPAHIKLQMNPLDYDDSKALSHKLWHSLTLIDLPPICSGLISFQMHYAVWGGESELILEENAKITPELNVWPEKKENNLSTNEITFLHSFRLIGDTEESLIEDKKEKLNLINEKGYFTKNFSNWTSGNNEIDELLRDSQSNLESFDTIMEWIPFEDLINVEYLAEGGFAIVYSAEWRTGCINEFDMIKCKFERASSEEYGNVHVILKRFCKSINGLDYLLYELKQYRKISGVSGITRCFGVTRRPETGEYLLVVEYNGIDISKLFNNAENSSKFITLNERLNILYEVAKGISAIHSRNLVHQDLHPGNILYHISDSFIGRATITDFGFCKPLNESSNSGRIYGVLSYIAPEVLKGNPFTKASDIYSFGSIMYLLGCGYAPFKNDPNDASLILKIMDGERPQIKGVPEFYKNLMISCWDNDPNNRPTIDEIVEIVKTWVYSPDEPSEEIKKEIERAEEILKKNSFTEVPSIHFQAYSMSNSFLTLSVLIEEFSTLGIDLTITT